MKYVITLSFLCLVAVSFAQTLAYGPNITLADAKKVAAASEAYAVGKSWTTVIAIVDTGGNLVYLQRSDNTQIGSLEVALSKAKTANNFKRPTKAFQDGVAAGGENLRILSLPDGIIAVEGGELLIAGGKIIGAIGVSGLTAAQDTEVAKVGVAVIK
ncbi:MAG TPA: heme-binding protein [Cyclobacteriaceae bacterium]|nr:heme-binding protein [Cyclobacteriaceae bacterium]